MQKILWLAFIGSAAAMPMAGINCTRVGCNIMLPVETGNYDLAFVFNFTRYLHGIYHFHSFVAFSERREFNRAPHIIVRPLEQALMEEFNTPVVAWGRNRKSRLCFSLGLNNLVFVYISSVHDPILSVVSSAMEGMHYMPMIFIFKRIINPTPNLREIRQFFNWCWQENILNVALTYQVIRHRWRGANTTVDIRNEVFNYTPFPEMRIFNATQLVLRNRGNFIRDSIKNVHGYRFHAPMFMDTPTVFLTDYEKHRGKRIQGFITGTAGRTFHEYVHFVNGSVRLKPTHILSYYHFQKATLTYAAERKIDIGIHPYSSLLPNANLTEGSYPIGHTNACIIVPVIPEIAHGQYIMHTLPLTIWLLWILELLSLFLIQCIHLGHLNIGSGILYSFRTLMAQPLNVHEFEKRRSLFRSLHLFVILLSVLVNSGFSASLTSILSTTLVGKQITSVNDLLKSGLKIMLSQYEKEVYFDQHILPKQLEKILLLVNESVVTDHKDILNTSYAYIVTTQEWRKYDFQQQLLWQPKFRIAHTKNLCTVKQFSRFPVQWDSPFIKSLERFIIMSTDAGLRSAWQNWSIYQATRLKLIKMFIPEEEKDYRPFTINHFLTIIFGYCFCMAISIFVFCGELIWARIEKLKGQGLLKKKDEHKWRKLVLLHREEIKKLNKIESKITSRERIRN